MRERQRLLALLECYDEAIEELYVLGDRGLLDLILRLERRRGDAARRLASLDEARVSQWVAQEITTPRPQIEGRLAAREWLPGQVSSAGTPVRAVDQHP